MRVTPLNELDQLFLHMDTVAEPWSVQLEMRASGRLNLEKLVQAIIDAANNHPIARANIAPYTPADRSYDWEIPERITSAPLEVAECESDADVQRVRARLQSFAPRLNDPPPFACTLARHPEGDYLMLNLHHTAGDGMSAFRLMNAIVRFYRGEPDPVPDFDPLEKRNLSKIVRQGGLMDRIGRISSLLEYLSDAATPPIRIHPVDGEERPGYAFELIEIDADTSARIAARRQKPATVNDLMLAALGMTIKEWNRQYGGETGRISFMMPVNTRPAEWSREVIGNYASYLTVSLAERCQDNFSTAMEAVAEHTQRLKKDNAAALLIDLLDLPSALPAAIKKNLPRLLPLTGNRAVETVVLSNLGRLDDPGSFGEEGGPVREIWFSPPGRMPLGASLGAATVGGRMFVTLRYRYPQFSAEAASEFADLYRHNLVGH